MNTVKHGRTALIGHDALQSLVDLAIGEYGVPGAAVGVLAPAQDGTLHADAAWAGVTNQTTGYPVIEDTLFQIGSISKIWTTVLAMQLIDEGVLRLDTQVKDVLPDFRIVGSPETTEHCTIRDLMCHVSGIEGDAFPGTLGRGDDCVAQYVEYIGRFPARTPLGGPLSYSNGAFVVLGRVIEVLRDMTWDEALRRYIAEPAGLGHVWTLPEDVLRFSACLGHQRAVAIDQTIFPAPVQPAELWHLPRCTGPCGQVSASIDDLLGFVSLFLNDGIAPNGARIVSAGNAALMTREQVDLREQGVQNNGWGLGWQLPNWGSEPAFGHGGATEGQRANVVVFPQRRTAIAVLTNADAGTQMAAHLTSVLAARAGVAPRPTVQLDETPISAEDMATVLGTYERLGEHMEFKAGGPTGVLAVIDPDEDDGPYGVQLTLPLYHTTQGFYAIQRPDERDPTEIAFVSSSRGTRYVASGHRVTPKVA
ncbi:MAG: beta-lactamase family protein [Bifidobacterium sp.]|jgi:CubicO group peptidase (beta-lactamase class C family)|nr:beta-lactamase family protein [Bifidobacterium sp.]